MSNRIRKAFDRGFDEGSLHRLAELAPAKAAEAARARATAQTLKTIDQRMELLNRADDVVRGHVDRRARQSQNAITSTLTNNLINMVSSYAAKDAEARTWSGWAYDRLFTLGALGGAISYGTQKAIDAQEPGTQKAADIEQPGTKKAAANAPPVHKPPPIVQRSGGVSSGGGGSSGGVVTYGGSSGGGGYSAEPASKMPMYLALGALLLMLSQ